MEKRKKPPNGVEMGAKWGWTMLKRAKKVLDGVNESQEEVQKKLGFCVKVHTLQHCLCIRYWYSEIWAVYEGEKFLHTYYISYTKTPFFCTISAYCAWKLTL